MANKTTILKPDSFPGDWYGWVTNQISHIFVGIALVFFASLICFYSFGEMPNKLTIYGAIFAGYVAFEVLVQGWRGVDTVEDTTFVVGYGAAGVLAGFTEVEVGSPYLELNLLGLAPFFAVAIVHLIAGAMHRRS